MAEMRAQDEARKAADSRRELAGYLYRIEKRLEAADKAMDERFDTLSKRIDGVIDSRLNSNIGGNFRRRSFQDGTE